MNKKSIFTIISAALFVLFVIWWVILFITAPEGESIFSDYFVDTYAVIAGAGAVFGLYISSKWDFLKSYVGKSLFFLSLGLFSQFFGHIYYSALFYIYGIENAYPSFGEVFYLATIPFYILGAWYLAKASGLTLTLKDYRKKVSAAIFPLLMIGVSYFAFLRSYETEGLSFTYIFLDYVYPLGQALFVSLAILTFYMTKNTLGGVMKPKVTFILLALIFQYIADSLFIYETRAEIWYPAGPSDLMFVISYFLMAIGMIRFLNINDEIKQRNNNHQNDRQEVTA
jgi:hypothetical protein